MIHTVKSSLRLTPRLSYTLRALMGLAGLDNPSDFELLADKAIEASTSLVARVTSNAKPNAQVLADMDRISDIVCSVVDPANLVRRVHSDRKWRAGAEVAACKLFNFINELNVHPGLHRGLKNVVEDTELLAGMTTEEVRLAKSLHREFEIEGAYLSEEDKTEVLRLREQIMQLGNEFVGNASQPRGSSKEQQALPAWLLTRLGVPRDVIDRLPALDLSPASRQALHAEDPDMELRVVRTQQMQFLLSQLPHQVSGLANDAIWKTRHPNNLVVLREMLQLKTRVASLIGAQSHAHLKLQDSMSEGPEEVIAWLERLSDQLTPKALTELRQLESLTQSGELQSWDLPLATSKFLQAKFNLRGVDEYFSLGGVMQGIELLCNRLFGVTMEATPLEHGEGWHSTVRKVLLRHEEDGIVGELYLDLLPREGKTRMSVQYTIRGPHEMPSESGGGMRHGRCAMVCSFGSRALSDQGDWSKIPLTHDETVTLMHELGHVLHSFFGRSRFQHLSGTRVEIGFMETPSTLFENFAWDPRVLRLFAKHNVTGHVIPDDLLESLQGARHAFVATELKSLIVQSILDLKCHSIQLHEPFSTMHMLREIESRHLLRPSLPGTHFHSSATHLVEYDAGYYSYVFGKVFSSLIWNMHFQADPLSRSAGEVIRRRLLQPANVRSPREILRDVLGNRDPSPEDFVQSIV